MRKWIVSLLVLCFCVAIPAQASASAPPAIQDFGASSVRNHEATISFSIDPEGLATEYEIKYGTVPGVYYPYTYWESELPAGEEPVTLKFKMPPFWAGQLGAGTEYHWFVIAKNAAGTTEGPVQHFTTTNGPKPGVATGSASNPTSSSASFSGSVDPEGFPLTGCRFRYVTEITHHFKGFSAHGGDGTMLLGKTVPCEESLAEIGSGSEPVAVHADVSELEPGPYHFRLEAQNAFEDAFASGAPFGPPAVLESGVEAVTATEALVWGRLLKFTLSSDSYRVEYENNGVWQQTPWAPAPGEAFPEVEAGLTCLTPDSEYRFRVVAANQFGSFPGPEGSFTTAPGAGCPSPAPLAGASLGTPPQASSSPVAKAAPKKAKKGKKKQRPKLRRNATLTAPR